MKVGEKMLLYHNPIQTKYRRAQDVKFFDEILEEWNK